jgi:hypothetical protein
MALSVLCECPELVQSVRVQLRVHIRPLSSVSTESHPNVTCLQKRTHNVSKISALPYRLCKSPSPPILDTQPRVPDSLPTLLPHLVQSLPALGLVSQPLLCGSTDLGEQIEGSGRFGCGCSVLTCDLGLYNRNGERVGYVQDGTRSGLARALDVEAKVRVKARAVRLVEGLRENMVGMRNDGDDYSSAGSITRVLR